MDNNIAWQHLQHPSASPTGHTGSAVRQNAVQMTPPPDGALTTLVAMMQAKIITISDQGFHDLIWMSIDLYQGGYY